MNRQDKTMDKTGQDRRKGNPEQKERKGRESNENDKKRGNECNL